MCSIAEIVRTVLEVYVCGSKIWLKVSAAKKYRATLAGVLMTPFSLDEDSLLINRYAVWVYLPEVLA